MGHEEFLAEAVRLATESVEKGWGGPFGAVITHDREIIARGQNHVPLTAGPTAHGEAYDDFQKPPDQRSITVEQIHPELGAEAYRVGGQAGPPPVLTGRPCRADRCLVRARA